VKNLGSARNTVATAVYDAGFMKVHGAYGVDQGVNSALPRNSASPYGVAVTPSTDSRVALLGATVPFGQHVWLASWIHKDDRTARNQDATQLALGYRYLLSKRTDLYVAAAHLRNRNGAAYTVGSAIEAGTGNRAVNLGMRHNF
jgi:predicted porin